MENHSPLLHSIADTKKLLGNISNGHFYNLVNRQELELIKLGSMSRVTDRSIRALIDRGGIKKLNKVAKLRDEAKAAEQKAAAV